MDVLYKLIEDGVIDEVKSRLMSGKEAAVFIVERDGVRLAAKVYKEREQRTFRATADYVEGRNQTRNSRDKRAMGRRTRYGKELVEESWREMEYRALNEAFDAGVRVPEPVLLYDNVLLMELLVDEDGEPASRLADFELTPEVAELLHREIFGQVRLLLQNGKVHGDLSAFNILITARGPTIIDMPQVVDASGNSKASEILTRDLRNITEHLARFAPRLLRFRDCGDVLWRHYQRGTLDRALVPEEGGVRSLGKRGRPARDERARKARGNERPSEPRGSQPHGNAQPPRQQARSQGNAQRPRQQARPSPPSADAPRPSAPQPRAPKPSSAQEHGPPPRRQGEPAPSEPGGSAGRSRRRRRARGRSNAGTSPQ